MKAVGEPQALGEDEVLLQVRMVGLVWERSEFVPRSQSDGELSEDSWSRGVGHRRGGGCERIAVDGRNGRDAIALFQLRKVSCLSARPRECLPMQSDARCAARWRAH